MPWTFLLFWILIFPSKEHPYYTVLNFWALWPFIFWMPLVNPLLKIINVKYNCSSFICNRAVMVSWDAVLLFVRWKSFPTSISCDANDSIFFQSNFRHRRVKRETYVSVVLSLNPSEEAVRKKKLSHLKKTHMPLQHEYSSHFTCHVVYFFVYCFYTFPIADSYFIYFGHILAYIY